MAILRTNERIEDQHVYELLEDVRTIVPAVTQDGTMNEINAVELLLGYCLNLIKMVRAHCKQLCNQQAPVYKGFFSAKVLRQKVQMTVKANDATVCHLKS